MGCDPWRDKPLLFRAAERGIYGKRRTFERGSITDALFVYLEGVPESEACAALTAGYLARPWVCLTRAWEDYIREMYPHAGEYRRTRMKPLRRFRLPEIKSLPEDCRLATMDERAFNIHPFDHGANYPSYASFRAQGSGAVVWHGDAIVASASSFLSLDGEVELDVSTRVEFRGLGLAGACTGLMLRDCMAQGIAVHWDAQNEASLHLAEKFGFEVEQAYSVYWVPDGGKCE